MSREAFVPTKASRLCSEHFEDECFKVDMFEAVVGHPRGTRKRRVLKEGAVPTLFAHRTAPIPRLHTTLNRPDKKAGKETSE